MNTSAAKLEKIIQAVQLGIITQKEALKLLNFKCIYHDHSSTLYTIMDENIRYCLICNTFKD